MTSRSFGQVSDRLGQDGTGKGRDISDGGVAGELKVTPLRKDMSLRVEDRGTDSMSSGGVTLAD